MTSSVAIAVSLLATPIPAFATVDTDFGTHPDADAACDAALNPNDKSDFTTYAVGDPQLVSQSSVTTDNGSPYDVHGIGTQSSSIGGYRGAHQNGQSVNIHAYGDKLVTWSGYEQSIPTKTVTKTIWSVNCHTHKPFQNGGNDHDPHELNGEIVYYNAPAGLVSHQANYSSEETTYGSRLDSHPNTPWVDPVASQYGVEFVICISPTKNPGTWRGANGYVSQIDGRTCSTQWYKDIGASTPSVSVPAQ